MASGQQEEPSNCEPGVGRAGSLLTCYVTVGSLLTPEVPFPPLKWGQSQLLPWVQAGPLSVGSPLAMWGDVSNRHHTAWFCGSLRMVVLAPRVLLTANNDSGDATR